MKGVWYVELSGQKCFISHVNWFRLLVWLCEEEPAFNPVVDPCRGSRDVLLSATPDRQGLINPTYSSPQERPGKRHYQWEEVYTQFLTTSFTHDRSIKKRQRLNKSWDTPLLPLKRPLFNWNMPSLPDWSYSVLTILCLLCYKRMPRMLAWAQCYPKSTPRDTRDLFCI